MDYKGETDVATVRFVCRRIAMNNNCSDVARLLFRPIAWEDKSTSRYGSYSYAVAYVYQGLYVVKTFRTERAWI